MKRTLTVRSAALAVPALALALFGAVQAAPSGAVEVSCSGQQAWTSAGVYTGGTTVTYAGHSYTAKWWTQGETPGSADA